MRKSFFAVVGCLLTVLSTAFIAAAEPARPIKVLFLGDQGHHRPADRFRQIEPIFKARHIGLEYTEQLTDLDAKKLGGYDALLVYANWEKISPDQEKALLDYVGSGHGFVPIHCASYCFLNSPAYIDLVGAQFQKHGTGTFRTRIVASDHPIMQGFDGFQSWDETYTHTKHNEKDRTVLELRADSSGFEPWTWVRTQGKGRVFYTAWGHDERTWGEPGFQSLLERGIRWSIGQDPGTATKIIDPQAFPVPKITRQRTDVAPFEYVEVGAKIPNYSKGEKWGTQAEAISKMQKPLPAAESIKHIVTPEGFEPRLFMSEEDYPDGGKPISMAWDERGRLWVCETIDYPNELQPAGQGRDRIRICEDTDGDYRADKFTIFAEKLSIPTTLTFSRGGVIVQNASETLYLKDTDGDDVADERTVLFTGWGTSDTHGGVSNFQYGLDNWIWGVQGYNESRPAGPSLKSEAQTFRQGFFRFKPDGSEIEFIRSTNNNTWGLGISEEGLIFGSTANHNPSVFMPIPNRYYERVRGWSPEVLGTIADTHLFQPSTDKIRQMDHHGGYTAGCGHALYTARTYPKEYWNRVAFVCEPTGHLVGSFVLRREGSDFTSSSPFNLFASDDEWTSPIMAEVGPDGNVWVLDWYNFIIQHNPTPIGFKTGKGNAYETDLRDKRHGRVYRIVYVGEKGTRSVEGRAVNGDAPAEHGTRNAERGTGNREGEAPAEPFTLENASPEKLVATLKHDNFLWRRHAQRLLVERGQLDVVPQLAKLIEDQSVDAIGLNVGAIHGLWTMEALNVWSEKTWSNLSQATRKDLATSMHALSSHKSPGVRQAAIETYFEGVGLGEVDKSILGDSDAQVRLTALLAFADSPQQDAKQLSETTMGETIARFLASADGNRDRWLIDAAISAAASHDFDFFASVTSPLYKDSVNDTVERVASRVAEHYGRRAPETIGELISRLGDADPKLALVILNGLDRGWPRDKPAELSAEAEGAIAMLFKSSPELRGPLATLAAKLGSKELEKFSAEISQSYVTQINDDKLELTNRIEAAKQLVSFRKADLEVVNQLLKLLGPKTEPELAAGIVAAIGLSEAESGGEAIIAHIRSFTPQTRQAAIRLLLARAAWSPALLAALESDSVQLAELTLDQKQALANHPEKAIAERAKKLLARGGGLPNADRQKVLEEFMPITKVAGDAAAGKLVFEKQCAKCHMHSGQGNKIGPDLTGMAVHPKAELLVHILDPSRSVEANYRVYTVAMDDGRILTGLLAGESKTAIEIVDAEAKRHTIIRDEVEELVGSAKSLMPEGFEKQVSKDDITNLLEFLTQRGKYTPIPLQKYATVLTTKGFFFEPEGNVERLIFADWSPKTFQGVPFVLVDPQGDRIPNAIMLNGPQGKVPPTMPRSVTLPCNQPAKAIHFLSGVSGWGFPVGEKGTETMIVRLKYNDGTHEDHALLNGQHFADYIRRVDVPGSQFAFALRDQQIRYLAVQPKKADSIKEIELIKGKDATAPVVMAVTIEGLEMK